MKFNKREKVLFNILIILVLVAINIYVIYKPMKEKERELRNTINKIEVSKKIVNDNNIKLNKKEDIVFTLENYLKSGATVNYIKKEKEEKNSMTLNINISGSTKPLTGLISNINSISSKIYLNDIEIFKLDEEIVECKMQITIYTV